MVSAEGDFPKVGNDPIYASEINGLLPKQIGEIKQLAAFNASGTGFIKAGGSIVYDASSEIKHGFLIDGNIGKDPTNGTIAAQIRISGAGANYSLGSSVTTSARSYVENISMHHFLTVSGLQASGGNLGSSYVFFQEGNNNVNSAMALAGDFRVMGF